MPATIIYNCRLILRISIFKQSWWSGSVLVLVQVQVQVQVQYEHNFFQIFTIFTKNLRLLIGLNDSLGFLLLDEILKF